MGMFMEVEDTNESISCLKCNEPVTIFQTKNSSIDWEDYYWEHGEPLRMDLQEYMKTIEGYSDDVTLIASCEKDHKWEAVYAKPSFWGGDWLLERVVEVIK